MIDVGYGTGEGYTPPDITYVATPVPITTTASLGQSSLYNVLAGGIAGASQILGARYAVPQLTPGQYIARTPQGSVMYQIPTSETTTSMLSPFGSGTLSTLVIGVVAFALFRGGKGGD
jgi:hypothetical protein